MAALQPQLSGLQSILKRAKNESQTGGCSVRTCQATLTQSNPRLNQH